MTVGAPLKADLAKLATEQTICERFDGMQSIAAAKHCIHLNIHKLFTIAPFLMFCCLLRRSVSVSLCHFSDVYSATPVAMDKFAFLYYAKYVLIIHIVIIYTSDSFLLSVALSLSPTNILTQIHAFYMQLLEFYTVALFNRTNGITAHFKAISLESQKREKSAKNTWQAHDMQLQ